MRRVRVDMEARIDPETQLHPVRLARLHLRRLRLQFHVLPPGSAPPRYLRAQLDLLGSPHGNATEAQSQRQPSPENPVPSALPPHFPASAISIRPCIWSLLGAPEEMAATLPLRST